MVKVKIDMTGWNMWEHGVVDSRLTIICQTEDYIKPDGRREAMWKCSCNCGSGKEVITNSHSLKSGNTKSCGCINRELISNLGKNNKKYNIYKFNGEYGVGICSNTNDEFYFDWEDFDKIKEYCWFKHTTKSGYVSIRAHEPQKNRKQVKLYKIISDYEKCDHINRNPFDNRKSNLRPATSQQNARNHSIRKNNKSGITGVWFLSSRNKWVASINIEKYKRIILGYFENKNEAIKVRLIAEAKYYGEFSPQKHLFEKYNI